MKRTLLAMETGLIAVTAVLLGYVGYAWGIAHYTQARGHVIINRPIEHERLTPVEGSLLGTIEIPRIGLSSIILEGTEAATLRRAVGHIPGTPLPGEAGNVSIAGHRDTFFRPLRRIASGDDIIVKTAKRRVTYRVESTRIVDPEDVEVLDNTPADTVTLVTCYPFHFIGAASKRFVVRAIRIREAPQNSPSAHVSVAALADSHVKLQAISSTRRRPGFPKTHTMMKRLVLCWLGFFRPTKLVAALGFELSGPIFRQIFQQ